MNKKQINAIEEKLNNLFEKIHMYDCILDTCEDEKRLVIIRKWRDRCWHEYNGIAFVMGNLGYTIERHNNGEDFYSDEYKAWLTVEKVGA